MDVMVNYVYTALDNYFHLLSQKGYCKQEDVNKLLLLIFYYNLLYEDYRGYINSEDYSLVDKALNCLYGTSCLMPYPKYLKMGEIHLGEITELATRVKAIENTEVLKISDSESIEDSDVIVEKE